MFVSAGDTRPSGGHTHSGGGVYALPTTTRAYIYARALFTPPAFSETQEIGRGSAKPQYVGHGLAISRINHGEILKFPGKILEQATGGGCIICHPSVNKSFHVIQLHKAGDCSGRLRAEIASYGVKTERYGRCTIFNRSPFISRDTIGESLRVQNPLGGGG